MCRPAVPNPAVLHRCYRLLKPGRSDGAHRHYNRVGRFGFERLNTSLDKVLRIEGMTISSNEVPSARIRQSGSKIDPRDTN